MKLLKPMSGCTMLVYYPLGACQPVRLDCNPLGDIDSKLRCVASLPNIFAFSVVACYMVTISIIWLC